MLVNNAGVAWSTPLQRTTLDDWRAHLDANATGAFLCTRAVIGGMIERGDGRIVTVASVAGLVGSRYTAAYTASKHAVIGLMRATGRSAEEAEASIVKMTPLGRLLTPEEVAFAVEFLAAPAAGAINGQTLVLDGGGIQS